MGTTVEHVKQLRDDITSTTAFNLRESLLEVAKLTDERSMRLEARMSSLEINLSKIVHMLENPHGTGVAGGRERMTTPASEESTASGSRIDSPGSGE